MIVTNIDLSKSIREINPNLKTLSLDELKTLKHEEVRGKGRISLLKKLDKRILNFNKPKCGRSNNGSWEKNLLSQLIKHIRDNTPAGLKLKNSFRTTLGEDIESVKEKGGRGCHYDLLITTTSGKIYKTEVKGSYNFTSINSSTPWKTGVQFSNGNPKNYRICKLYGLEWLKFITMKSNMKYPHTKEDFLNTIFKQGKNYDPWFKEVIDVIGITGGRKSGRKDLDFRTQFKKEVDIITKTVLEDLKEDINQTFQNCMKDKELWLQFHGDIDGNFNVLWTPGRNYSDVHTITVEPHNKDYKFKCVTDDLTFEAHMRWGYYQGVGNLRLDLK